MAGTPPAPGTVLMFLNNGMMVRTSCVETYRIGTWSRVKETPGTWSVMEDGRPAFTFRVAHGPRATWRMQQTMLPSNEQHDLQLTEIRKETVCRERAR